MGEGEMGEREGGNYEAPKVKVSFNPLIIVVPACHRIVPSLAVPRQRPPQSPPTARSSLGLSRQCELAVDKFLKTS